MNIKQLWYMTSVLAKNNRLVKDNRGITSGFIGLIVMMILFVSLFPVFLVSHASLTGNLSTAEQVIWSVIPTFIILGLMIFVVKASGIKVSGI